MRCNYYFKLFILLIHITTVYLIIIKYNDYFNFNKINRKIHDKRFTLFKNFYPPPLHIHTPWTCRRNQKEEIIFHIYFIIHIISYIFPIFIFRGIDLCSFVNSNQ